MPRDSTDTEAMRNTLLHKNTRIKNTITRGTKHVHLFLSSARLYNRLCRSVGRPVGWSLFAFSAFTGVFRITAPAQMLGEPFLSPHLPNAHPHATSVAVYPALFYYSFPSPFLFLLSFYPSFFTSSFYPYFFFPPFVFPPFFTPFFSLSYFLSFILFLSFSLLSIFLSIPYLFHSVIVFHLYLT